jgi:hypothetical protein
LEAFLVSTGLVAVAEIGDKTQLLAMILATRYRRPVPIILGILVATLANHALAAWAGAAVAAWLGPDAMRWILGILFLVMAVLVPDSRQGRRGPEGCGRCRRLRRNSDCFLPGRDRRQDPDRHGGLSPRASTISSPSRQVRRLA